MATTINGSAGVVTNSGAVYDGIQSGTAVTASGTSVDFTDIPSWVKRITVMFNGLSTNGTSIPIVQLGDSGGIENTSYIGSAGLGGTEVAISVGFNLNRGNAAVNVIYGNMYINLIDSANNAWIANGQFANTSPAQVTYMAGAKSLSDTLDRIRITTVNGTDTFDAGSINILWEF